MVGSVFDSAILSGLFPAGEVRRLFTDSAEIRAMLIVEGALAKVQGAQGVIPKDSAAAISRAATEVLIDPAALTPATGQNGVSVPALVAAFRTEMQAPEHARHVHWGATSQDIIDTGLMLRLRQVLTLVEADLRETLAGLADLAADHAGLPMAGRSYGQHATPTSFGAVVASWGEPMLTLAGELQSLRESCLLVSLSGAVGTAAALGPDAAQTRAALARELGLGDPGRSWHTDRTPILRLADWFVRISLAMAKMGEDVTELAQTGIGEISSGGSGASSTMPQKQNPVAASALTALSRQGAGLNSVLQGASVHRHQRDGAAWFTEWMCLPQIVLGAAASTGIAAGLARSVTPKPDAMRTALSEGLGMIHAEALSFELAATMPRPDAQSVVKALCREAQEQGRNLRDLVARDWPELDVDALFDPARQMGNAPLAARSFVEKTAGYLARGNGG